MRTTRHRPDCFCLATVIATGRSAEKLELVRAQGADHVIALREGWRLKTQDCKDTEQRRSDSPALDHRSESSQRGRCSDD